MLSDSKFTCRAETSAQFRRAGQRILSALEDEYGHAARVCLFQQRPRADPLCFESMALRPRQCCDSGVEMPMRRDDGRVQFVLAAQSALKRPLLALEDLHVLIETLGDIETQNGTDSPGEQAMQVWPRTSDEPPYRQPPSVRTARRRHGVNHGKPVQIQRDQIVLHLNAQVAAPSPAETASLTRKAGRSRSRAG